jgi:hypothetical protein
MAAMRQREAVRPLQGDIRIDDAYLGGEHCGGKPGCGSANKVAFVAAVEMHEGEGVCMFSQIEHLALLGIDGHQLPTPVPDYKTS